MLKLLLTVAFLAAVASAAPYWHYGAQYGGWNPWYGNGYGGGWPYYSNPYFSYWGRPGAGRGRHYYDPVVSVLPHGKYIFYGEFYGTCEETPDGLYYVDEKSFAYCHNKQKTIQPCAEGAANPPAVNFQHGQYYAFLDFCSINLVANGYNNYPTEPNAYIKEAVYDKVH